MSTDHANILKKVAIWAAGIIGGIIILIIALVCGVTWWLTPERLARIVNEEVTKNTDADVDIHNLSYTIWSSYPRLNIEMDSISVKSRAFDSLPDSIKGRLPEDSRLLMKAGHISGGLNIRKILTKKICLEDISVEALQLNLVSLNDSTANYNIVPATEHEIDLPYFSARRIMLKNGGNIRFRDLQSAADIDLKIDSLDILRRGDDDVYRIGIGADADVMLADRELLQSFPIDMKGDVTLKFDPFNVSTSGFGLKAGNIPAYISSAVELGKEISLNSMDVKINQFNVNELMGMLPSGLLAGAGDIDADVDVKVSAHLAAPYKVVKDEYPSVNISLEIPRGKVAYSGAGIPPIKVPDINMKAILDFDGKNPLASRLSVPELKLEGYGADLKADLGLSSFGPAPVITADINGEVSLERLAQCFSSIAPYGPKGTAKVAANIAFRLMETSKQIENLRLNADADLNNIAMKVPGMLNSLTIQDGTISIKNGEKFISLSQSGSFGGDRFDIALDATGLSMNMISGGERTDMKMNHFGLQGKAIDVLSGSPKGSGNISIKDARIAYKSDSMVMTVRGLDADLAITQPRRPIRVQPFDTPASWTADVAETYTATTPRLLSFSSIQPIISMLSGWNVAAKVKAREGDLRTYSLPVRNRFSGLDLVAGLDSVELKSLRLRTFGAALALKGKVSNLRQFLGSPNPAPLYLFLDAAADTINVNQLAAAYEEGLNLTLGREGLERWLNDTTIRTTDSVTLLIPRNVVARINASVKRVEYEDLAFYGIGGRISMANGDLRIDTVALHSDFFNAYGKALMSTSNIQNLNMKASVNVPEVNLENMFDNFTSILEKTPELGNLSGYLSATTNLGMRIYPAMVADLPTLYANIGLHGRDLQLQQNKFIRHITKLMMIREKGPLHFDNLNVNAALRDNILMLYPFRFGLSEYTFEFGGINNLAGEMYYHVGLEHSPLPIPFGVNIKGTFSKPEIHLGGAGWKDTNGLPVAGGIMEAEYINLPFTLRRMNRQFIHKAAAGYIGTVPVAKP